MNERILFVDDDETGREVAVFNLVEAGYKVDAVADGGAAIERFSPEHHDLVVTDVRMPVASGLDLLAHVKSEAADVPVVVITAHSNVETAVRAMKAGAYDFIEKPFSRDVLLLVVNRALERVRLAKENRTLRLQAAGVERPIVATSAIMIKLLETTDRVARSTASVLVSGESGTGKELIARRLHTRSARSDGSFVSVSCAAMPSELLESELFGHEKGAYTGASKSRLGRFRTAQRGTIFLDEVGEIPLALQGKLLRVLQERVIDVVGLDRPVPVDVRVVAATNQPLPERIRAGTFREDLYYRLNVVDLKVPALRERPEDVVPLAHHFVARAAGGRAVTLAEEVIARLTRYRWPGNVRELENACERMVLLSDGDVIRPEDLPRALLGAEHDAPADDPEWPPLPAEGLSLVDLERRVIERALEIKQGNVSQAAVYLRVPRHVLAYRIEKFGIRRG